MSSQERDSSGTAAGREASKKRQKGQVVKSRYLQYDKKVDKKVLGRLAAEDISRSPVKRSATKPRSVVRQKCETSAGGTASSFNQSSFGNGSLQSTLLGEDKSNRPDLDLSAINPKPVCEKTCGSESSYKKNERTDKKKAVDLTQELESQTLLLTYLRVKAGKNLAKLEKKMEENLLKLHEEKERQQEKLFKLKREILLKERERKLDDALDKQLEVLPRLIPVCEQFKQQYKSFAVSLDATRHELPIKNIHIEGDMITYLDELQKQLTITQELLTEIMPSNSEESAKTCGVLKELKEVSQKLDKELQRSFTQVENLSFEVSKEVSLHNQSICEENHGLDVVKRWYFN
ncbi:HAUS augmin-like complex subunit 8 isoform X1 [Falco naumanni]|uniref:HAUS augmin-like complex subunit 8 isoform X1 n=1 Tax=Falco naumanni TaxID=148594 RepID=UPI001ADE2046|nr:HAUS augmin-like complex subunit 8 isoform X1 [Falco naumanni]